MSFIENLLAKHSQRVDYSPTPTTPAPTPRRRTMIEPPHRMFNQKGVMLQPIPKASGNEQFDSLQPAGGTSGGIVLRNSQQYLAGTGKQGVDENSSADVAVEQIGGSMEAVKKKKIKTSLCPIETGLRLNSARNRPEETIRLERKIMDSVSVRMDVDTDVFHKMIEHGSQECKIYGAGMLFYNNLIAAINEKAGSRRVSPQDARIEVIFDNRRLFDEDEQLLTDKSGEEFSVNKLFFSVVSGGYTVKKIAQQCGNLLLRKTIYSEDYYKYSTSEKPKPPQISLPSEMMNPIIGLISRCIRSKEAEDKELHGVLSLVYKGYLTNQLNNARSKKKIALTEEYAGEEHVEYVVVQEEPVAEFAETQEEPSTSEPPQKAVRYSWESA